MPEIVNGITVPIEGEPVDIPANLRTFAQDVGAAAMAAGADAAEATATELAIVLGGL